VTGRDRTITWQWAEVEAMGTVCNWQIDFVFRDARGNEYFRAPGQINNTCESTAYRAYSPVMGGKMWQYGQTCAEAFTNGQFITRACVSIVEDRD
jgi:hypothetical protein